MNVNTKEYWDGRFSSGDWESKLGRNQTRYFAKAQVKYFRISRDFTGSILDFGCGLGDAFPIYRRAYPRARLLGMDLSEVAVDMCNRRYGDLARFMQGGHAQVPEVDVIISSNVFEHLDRDIEVARYLLTRCTDLYITVPYKQNLEGDPEHVNTYDEHHFRQLGEYNCSVFRSDGWGPRRWDLWFHIHAKNLIRPLLGKNIRTPLRQVMFHFHRPPPAASLS